VRLGAAGRAGRDNIGALMAVSFRQALAPRVWMLAFVPAAAVVEVTAAERQVLLFALCCAAMVPLAGWIGRATEELAERAGGGLGGLANATFGNAAELILGIAALRHGLPGIVKASLTGSILGNLLLVLGAAMLAGGLRQHTLRFDATAARAQSSMLTLGAIALLAPAAFLAMGGRDVGANGASGAGGAGGRLSLAIALVLMATYGCGLLFSLRTHRRHFLGACSASEAAETPASFVPWSAGRAVAVLAAAAAVTAWVSETLAGVVEPAARALGMSDLFVGVVVLAVVGNAAEHVTAVRVARHGRADLALGIAVGSSAQVALFVAPLLVLVSRWVGPHPMDLAFSPAEVLAVGAAVAISGQVAGDGESNWLEGVQLLAVYAVLAALFFFLPG
jgi:Ca2+:H+ antiporter